MPSLLHSAISGVHPELGGNSGLWARALGSALATLNLFVKRRACHSEQVAASDVEEGGNVEKDVRWTADAALGHQTRS